MAGEALEIKVGADLEAATKAFEKLQKDIETAMKGGEASFKKFVSSYQQQLPKFTRGTADATNALTNLSRVAQDAPYGFVGIANNLNPLLESFQRLKTESGSTKGALQSLVAGLTGPAGVGLALGAVSSLLVAFGSKLGSTKDEIEKVASAFDTLTSSQVLGKAGPEFEKAFTSVAQLRDELQLAKEGLISKTNVVRHYNETLGDAIGKVTTLDQVEKALTDKADAYIRFTLLKAAANQALGEAAKKALQAAEINATQITAPAININDDNLIRSQKERQAKLIAILKSGAAAKVNEGKNALLKIAEDFNRQAADIAKEFNLDFLSGVLKTDKQKLQKKIKEKIDELTPPILRMDVIPYVRTPVAGADVVGRMKNNILADLLRNRDEGFKRQQEQAQALADTINSTLSPAFQGLFDSLTNGGNVMKSFLTGIANGLKSLLSRLAAALAQAIALKAVFSLLGVGQIGNIKNGSIGSIFKGLLGFADGGVVFGPTAALIGEGLGTSRSNPEIVAPLDKLKNLIGGAGLGGNVIVSGEFELRHDTLVAAFSQAIASQRRRY